MIPLFAFGVDATLDPQRFVLFGIRSAGYSRASPSRASSRSGHRHGPRGARRVVRVVAHALAVLAALVGAVVAVALCVVGSRATTTALAPLLESRRYREVVTIAAFVPLVLIGPAFAWLGSQLGEGPVDGDAVRGMVTSLADVAAWTPFGAPWGLGAAVHDGAWGLALARLVVALATLAVAWVVGQVARPRPRHAAHLRRGGRAKGLGFFSRFPRRPRAPSRHARPPTGCATALLRVDRGRPAHPRRAARRRWRQRLGDLPRARALHGVDPRVLHLGRHRLRPHRVRAPRVVGRAGAGGPLGRALPCSSPAGP